MDDYSDLLLAVCTHRAQLEIFVTFCILPFFEMLRKEQCTIWKEPFGVLDRWSILKEGTIVFACSKEKHSLFPILLLLWPFYHFFSPVQRHIRGLFQVSSSGSSLHSY